MVSSAVQPKTVLHYPRLDTVIMVEEAIKNAPNYVTKHALWRSLPKQVQYQTFCYIINYLLDSNKIYIGNDGLVVWTWNPELVKKVLLNQSLRVR